MIFCLYVINYRKVLAKLSRVCYTNFMMDLSKFSNKRICVATSGGVDSLSLLHYLCQRQAEHGYQLSALHCEHGIRGKESLEDANFVADICQAWGVPLYTYAENCPLRAEKEKVSLETAARNFRLECYQKTIEKGEDYIATAHHKDDDAETVLFRIARGSALSGVKGIEQFNGYMVRPFLDWSRADIEKYAKENDLAYRVDTTNFQLDATRNKLRNEILPKLEDAVAGAKGNITRFARLAAEDDDLLYRYAKQLLSECQDEELGQVYFVAFSEEKPLFRRACLLAMKALGVSKDYTAAHLDALFALQTSERGAVLDLPQNVQAKREEKAVAFFLKSERKPYEKNPPCLFNEKGYDGGRYEVKLDFSPIFEETDEKILRIDYDKLPKDAIFRYRKEGDEIQSFGGRKTLKKFFNEKKICVAEREYLPLIASEHSKEVYVVCGVDIAEPLKVTEATRQILYIKVRKKKGE